MSVLHTAVIVPFLAALFVPFLYKRLPRIHTGWFVLAIPLLLFLYLLNYIPEISRGNVIYATFPWITSLNINFDVYLDGLSLLFALLITGIGTLVVLYSIYYMSKETEEIGNFYVYLLLFMGAMLGAVLSDNIFSLYVFWELTSIASFLLIAYWYQRKKSRYGALKSMLITISGGLSMLAGFIILSLITNVYSIRSMLDQVDIITSHHLFIPAMLLILIGAFTKSAQFPFSIWLPDAMEAPTPVSAYLHSATMVKAGIYLVARFTPIFGGGAVWFWIVSLTGLITLLYGSVNAVKQYDLKAMLAFSTISQLGLVMSLLGMGSAALYYGIGDYAAIYAVASFTAIFHLFNHSTFKGLLFMVVGIIDKVTGTRDLRRLSGLIRIMPISFTVMTIGSFAMAGLPPFNGFLSKEMFFTAALNVSQLSIFNLQSLGILFPIIAWIASVFTFVYCLVLVFKTFLGAYQPELFELEVHEPPYGMLIPPIILALLVVLIFYFPNNLAEYLLKPAWISVMPSLAHDLNVHITHWHGFNTELLMTIGIVILGTLLYVTLKQWRPIYNRTPRYISVNNLYDFILEGGESASRAITNFYMNGSLRNYLLYILVFIILISSYSLVAFNGINIDFMKNDAIITVFEIALIIAMVIAALAVLLSNSRLVAIAANGTVGYLVSVFFVLFRAPDLALTQLVVETVSTVLFLLCFYHLPQLKKELTKIKFKLTNAIVSISVGFLVTIMALSANSTRLFESISYYYTNSYELAGARNIVNAILVDFRGFDTMLEISVLCIAGLGVYVLIKLRLVGGEKHEKIK
ncbi:MAG: Na+/H+ antiporter subunit A [Syntrophomonadaceae bacterium]|nr:Na+/H+ antiporter subunit A [Syntrophomonadaceae bacterium]